MVWNLRRVRGIGVLDWLWIMEFHEDGFPHWHLFVEVNEVGKQGMIGEKALKKYWKGGDYVHEDYIRNKGHWDEVVGYFEKNGYFEKGKSHQGLLPSWARNRLGRIRRFGAMVIDGCSEQKAVEGLKMDNDNGNKREQRPYCVILDQCGKNVYVEVLGEGFGEGIKAEVDYNVVRKKLESLGGSYVESVGFVAEMNWFSLKRFLCGFDALKKLWWALGDIDSDLKFIQ
jgi:hypothetical protein